MADKNLVDHSNEIVKRKDRGTKRGRTETSSSMGPRSDSPDGVSPEINFRQFVYELLLHRKVPKSQAAHITKNAWRKSTYRKKMPPLRQWFAFTEKEGKNVHELGTTNILAFLEFLRLEYNSYNMLKRGAALLRLLHRLIGKPVSQDDNYIIDKVMQATFNTHPPKIKRTNSTWDVNILLDHLVSLGPNSSITCTNKLAGKLALQLLITQMSRSSEIAQLQLSTMHLLPGALQFELKRPTKTFTHKNVKAQAQSNLQTMTIKEFPGNKLLCPLTTLMAYMDRTKFVRRSIDHLFVLVTTSVPHRASQATIVRWCKDILRDAGLGTYTLHSTRGASSTSAFLMGLPLDQIVTKVGWVHTSTFIKHYMKPIDASAPTHDDIVKLSPVLPDPHNFTRVIGDVNPRTKLVAETLPSQPTKEELLTSTIDETLGTSTGRWTNTGDCLCRCTKL